MKLEMFEEAVNLAVRLDVETAIKCCKRAQDDGADHERVKRLYLTAAKKVLQTAGQDGLEPRAAFNKVLDTVRDAGRDAHIYTHTLVESVPVLFTLLILQFWCLFQPPALRGPCENRRCAPSLPRRRRDRRPQGSHCKLRRGIQSVYRISQGGNGQTHRTGGSHSPGSIIPHEKVKCETGPLRHSKP